ncbi:MAG TPA: sigma-70 family RNA polymerase sigma factor [Gemmataceae bacterium]
MAKDSFAGLMEALRSGSDGAAREVFARFAQRLVALARRQFDRPFGHKIDPEDVVQSAYKSFFLRHREGKLEVGSWDSLWSLLTVITLRKCADRVEYFRAQRRDAAREVQAIGPGDRPEPWQQALDREPMPEEAAILAETVDQLFESLDPDERPILELSLEGYTAAEISQRLGRAERSVRRLRERVRKKLERMQAGPGDA